MLFSSRQRTSKSLPAQKSRRRARPAFDCLEGRQLLTATATLSNGTLTINADNSPTNDVVVSPLFPSSIRVVSTSSKNSTKDLFDITKITSIVFNGGTGANTFTNSTSLPALIHSHGNGDRINAGVSSKDVVTVDSANATINGGLLGNTTLAVTTDRFFTLTDTSLTTNTGTYKIDHISNVQLTLAGPGAALGGSTISLNGYSGAARIDSQGAIRTDYILGTGPTVINGGSGLNVLTVNNAAIARFANGVLTVNGVPNTLKNITNINISNTGGSNAIDLNGFTGSTFTTIAKAGNTVVRGGSGFNTIVSSAGTNIVLPSLGTDQVGGSNITRFLGVLPNVSPDQRNAAAGVASVLLEPNGTLDVAGPTGTGFSLLGSWSVSTNPTGLQTFTTSSNVVLKTAAGEFPFVVSPTSPLIIHAQGSFLGFGSLVDASLKGLTLDTSVASSPLRRLETVFGVHVASAGATWNIALGKDVPGSSQFPVEAAVPYLFATVNAGASASFGTQSFSASSSQALTVFLDPTDPSLYVLANGTNFKVGASVQGLIPFTPTQNLFQILKTTPVVFGNLFTTGTNPFAAGATVVFGNAPVTLNGPLVINFDANHSRNLAGVTPSLVQRIILGQLPLSQAFPDGASDLAIGVNGGLRVGYTGSSVPLASNPVIDYDLTLTSPVASFAYTPGNAHFAGTFTSVDPGFLSGKSTPLAYLGTSIKSISGAVEGFSNPNVSIQTSMSFTGALGVLVPSALISFSNKGIGIVATSISAPAFGAFDLTGTVDPNGDLRLNGTKTATVVRNAHDSSGLLSDDGPPPQYPLVGNFGLTYQGATNPNQVPNSAIKVSIIPLNIPQYNASNSLHHDNTRLDGAFIPKFQTDGKSFIQFIGGGLVTGTSVKEGILNTPDTLTPVNSAWALVGNQIVQSFNNPFDPQLKQNVFDLNSAAFPGARIAPRAETNPVATLVGRISEPDRNSTWTLTVDWGDGTPAQTLVFRRGSNGRQVVLHHRYRSPSPSGQPYQVVARWHDDQGRGNSVLLNVTVCGRNRTGHHSK